MVEIFLNGRFFGYFCRTEKFMDSSSTPLNKTFPSALSVALEILATNQFFEDDLLRKISSPIWAQIEKLFSLTLNQLSALQNLVESTNVASPVSDNTLSKEVVKARLRKNAKMRSLSQMVKD